jgi:hypothetical protein
MKLSPFPYSKFDRHVAGLKRGGLSELSARKIATVEYSHLLLRMALDSKQLDKGLAYCAALLLNYVRSARADDSKPND